MTAPGLTHFLARLEAASNRPIFAVDGDPARSGADLLRASAAVARRLCAAGPAGSRVVVAANPSFETLAAIVGAMRAGWIAVPLGLRYGPRELDPILADCTPTAVAGPLHPSWDLTRAAHDDRITRVVVDVPLGRIPRPDPPDPTDPSTACLIVYTSGTTGRSKGAVHTMRSLFGAMASLAEAWGFSPDDIVTHALPLHHVHGLCIGVVAALGAGAAVRLAPRFRAQDVATAFEAGATVYCGVPTQYRKILDHLAQAPAAARSLARGRLFTSGSAALPVARFEAFEAHTGHRILERYGMTETMITLSNPLDGPRVPGTVGRPLPGFETRLEPAGAPGLPDASELLVRGVGLFDGYFGDPGATAAVFDADGFFRTGDLVRRTKDGAIRIVGRRSADIIKSGDFKIAAREIEEVLRMHPAVAEVAVLGVPDATFGEAVAAAVVPAGERASPRLADELRAHCRRHLADFKKPRLVWFLDALPRNAMGKVQKHVLRDEAPGLPDQRASR